MPPAEQLPNGGFLPYVYLLSCCRVLSSLTNSGTLDEGARAPALSAISLLTKMTTDSNAPLSEATVSNLFSSFGNLVTAGRCRWANSYLGLSLL